MNASTAPALDTLNQLLDFIPDPALRLPIACGTLLLLLVGALVGGKKASAKRPGTADTTSATTAARKPGIADATSAATVAQRPNAADTATSTAKIKPVPTAADTETADTTAIDQAAYDATARTARDRGTPPLRQAPPVAIVREEPPAATTAEAIPFEDVQAIKDDTRESWLSRLRQGMAKSRDNLKANITQLFNRNPTFNEALLEDIHEVLYRADMGVKTVDRLVDGLRSHFGKVQGEPRWDSIRECLKNDIVDILKTKAPAVTHPQQGPMVILVVGVNGVGKTTSIGKLAAHFTVQDRRVILAAGDTFRAAAIEQLEIWGQRVGVDVIKHQHGSDPAAVAYDAVKAAMARKADILLIDTAGRLHNKQELMAELAKIKKVISRDLPGAPHEVWLVLDATTGQNAVQQVKTFKEVVDVTGLIITKLDGTAKGGIVVGITDQFNLPVRYIGVGEKAPDLREFSAEDFADSLI